MIYRVKVLLQDDAWIKIEALNPDEARKEALIKDRVISILGVKYGPDDNLDEQPTPEPAAA